MDCERIKTRLQEYLDKALPDDERRRVREHLDSCEECAREFEWLVALDRELRAEPLADVPGDLAAAVRARLERAAYSWGDVALAAASIAIVVGLFWLGQVLGVSDWVSRTTQDGMVSLVDTSGMGGGAMDLSPPAIDSLALKGYDAASAYMSSIVPDATGWGMVGLLLASALLAVGTNTACFRRARLGHVTDTRI